MVHSWLKRRLFPSGEIRATVFELKSVERLGKDAVYLNYMVKRQEPLKKNE